MSENRENSVNVQKIMKEINREIIEKNLFDELPAFSQIPMRDTNQYVGLEGEDPSLGTLEQSIGVLKSSYQVSSAFPVSGNPVKKVYKRLVRKSTQCVTVPMSEQLTNINGTIVHCMNQMMGIIQHQQKEIDQLKKA